MICKKCNHQLPDDSEFCQYCGSKIELSKNDVKGIPTDADIAAPQDAEDALKAIMAIQAKNTISAMEANKHSQKNCEDDDDFGLVPEKPIYTLALDSVEGETKYLKRLTTTSGEAITWKRRGSIGADGINGMIDIYDIFLPSGELYKTIYINMYGAKTSNAAPQGFVMIAPKASPSVTATNNTPKETKKYCSACGSEIDAVTKKCTGCGKQYFKGLKFKFSKSVVAIIVLAVCLITSCIFNFVQLSNNNDLKFRIENYETLVDGYRDQVAELESESWDTYAELRFFRNGAVIVGEDGQVYHKYGCRYLNDSTYWIFNIEYAEYYEYTPCSHCID